MTPPPSSDRPARTFIPKLFIAIVTGLCTARLAYLLRTYGVDVLVWDAWDFYRPVFDGESLWSVFQHQHGPHRQGVGMLLMIAIDRLTAWDVRAQGWAAAGLLILSCCLALWLKRRLFGPFVVWDALIPLVILSPAQWQQFAGIINLSHSVVPLLLILVASHVLLIQRPWLRHSLLAIVTFLIVYTGFGMFFGPVAILVLVLQFVRGMRSGTRAEWLSAALALAFATTTVATFFVGYAFEPAVEGWTFPGSDLTVYPLFAGRMMGRYFGYNDAKLDTLAVGWFFLVMLAGVFAASLVHAVRARTSTSAGLVLLTLSAFALLFTIGVAVGRAPGGIQLADSSRYVTLTTVGFLSIYFASRWIVSRVARTIYLVVLSTLALFGHARMSSWDEVGMWQFATAKRQAVTHLLKIEGPIPPDDPALFTLHPDPVDRQIAERLMWMREHRLSFYRDRD